MPAIYSLWIVGRNGGLLYSRVSPPPARSCPHTCPCPRCCFACTGLDTGCTAHPPAPSHLDPSSLQDFVTLPPIEFNDKLRLASSWCAADTAWLLLPPLPPVLLSCQMQQSTLLPATHTVN